MIFISFQLSQMNANFGTYSGMVSVTMYLIQLTAGSMAVTAVVTMYEMANVKNVPVNKKQLVRYLKKKLIDQISAPSE